MFCSSLLSKKKGNEAWIETVYDDNKLSFRVHHSKKPKIEGTIGRKGAVCPNCGTPVGYPYIRTESVEGRMSSVLMAIVGEGRNGRIYLDADIEHRSAADVEKPENYPEGQLCSIVRLLLYLDAQEPEASLPGALQPHGNE